MTAPARPPRTAEAAVATLVTLLPDVDALAGRWEGLYDAVVAHLFSAIGRGDLAAAQRVRDALQDVQPFVDRHLPPSGLPVAEAAVAFAHLLRVAHMGAEALERPAAERTAERPGDTTRAVLAVLRGAPDASLTRGDVHERLPPGSPTTARISQILDDLVRLGLATRLRVAQGQRVTGHYALSEAGEALCRRLEIAATQSDAARLARITGTVTSRGRTYDAAALEEMVPKTISWSMTVPVPQ
jgi:DNA-binding PadR family transcriptional regulator